jgi:4-hydroxy-tetrahydrodipicolinate reductase
MKIALVGYGKMGRMIEELAPSVDCQVVARFDSKHPFAAGEFDVAIDFSVPGAVLENVHRAADAGVNLVVGTTGWQQHLEEVKRLVVSNGIGLVYGANFSVGMNLFFRVIREAAELLKSQPEFDPWVWEMHHRSKKDAPSGTALKLADLIRKAGGRDGISISSTRAGGAPGTHTVGFDSLTDSLTFTHEARSRQGFALGALRAAQWIRGRKGCFEFSEVLWASPR